MSDYELQPFDKKAVKQSKEVKQDLLPNPQQGFFSRLQRRIRLRFGLEYEYSERVFTLPLFEGEALQGNNKKFPPNIVKNTRYNPFTFVPLTLFDQFKYFYNMFFLLNACSQFIPAFRVGMLFTYWLPLIFVIALAMAKEGFDDVKRYIQDRKANSQKYQVLNKFGELEYITSAEIRVGQTVYVNTDERIPADMALLHTSEKGNASFVRTDQLDGETDWKLRKAVPRTQNMSLQDIALLSGTIYAEAPRKDIYNFIGKITFADSQSSNQMEEPLTVENMLWANTVLASGHILGLVVYTGRETRSALNRNTPKTKCGHTDLEINFLTKILFCVLFVLAFVMVAMQEFAGTWFVSLIRFIVLFSSIIPISMRVNLDMAKLVYSFFIMIDKTIEGAIVRNSNLPEELGRISYVLTDKTGTLTQNEMVFKKLHIGTLCYRSEDINELCDCVRAMEANEKMDGSNNRNGEKSKKALKVTTTMKTLMSLRAAALCHNVTPVRDEIDDELDFDVQNDKRTNKNKKERKRGQKLKDLEKENENEKDSKDNDSVNEKDSIVGNVQPAHRLRYQASSPDEVALVTFTESVGIQLIERDLHEMTILVNGIPEKYEILEMFPFSSTTKRMGIILKNEHDEITFFIKGADVVMEKLIKKENSEWMREETDNMAREGLRTLVFGKKTFSDEEYAKFSEELHTAKCSLVDRENLVQKVVNKYEEGLDMLCITGVEDKLQTNVRSTLETLSNAGIKTWMLTGDKVETATCIALSSRLFKPSDRIFTLIGSSPEECLQRLADFSASGACLVLDGSTLQICLDHFPIQFVTAAREAPAVVCCRCSPTQKAMVVSLIREQSKQDCGSTCAIGDGGNDVSMILAADVGVGLEGKEGKQASLAADYSLTQFQHLSKLLLWHGRNSYKRSSKLAQFIIHRGLIISIIQFVFSVIFHFAAVAIYQGWLAVGYVTYYTMIPVFSLVLDQDLRLSVSMRFPELYSELRSGHQFGMANFFKWVFISVYQGGVIMLLTIFFFEDNLNNIVSITFTCLIMTELLNMILVVHVWSWPLVAAEVITVMMYFISMIFLPDYFDLAFITSFSFVWRVVVIVSIAALPISLIRIVYRIVKPPTYKKVNMSMRHTY